MNMTAAIPRSMPPIFPEQKVIRAQDSRIHGFIDLLPTSGRVFVSVANRDKRAMVFPVKRLADLGFEILATAGTAEVLRRNGIPCTEVRKHFETPRDAEPNIVEIIKAGGVDMVINTPYGNPGPRVDGYEIRTAAVSRDIPCVTTIQGAAAAVHQASGTDPPGHRRRVASSPSRRPCGAPGERAACRSPDAKTVGPRR